MTQVEPSVIDRLLTKGEAELRSKLHCDPYIGTTPRQPRPRVCSQRRVLHSLPAALSAACAAAASRPWPAPPHAPRTPPPTHPAVPYYVGGSLYARNPPFDERVRLRRCP